jgi:hypothetical protein
MAAAGVLTMVVYDAGKPVAWEASLNLVAASLVGWEHLLGKLQLQRVPDFLPDLLRTLFVVMEALQVKNQHWRKGLNVDLLGRGLSTTSRAIQCLQTRQVLECVGNVVDVGLVDVQLKRLVRLQRDRGLLARPLVLRPQLATEDLGDRALQSSE